MQSVWCHLVGILFLLISFVCICIVVNTSFSQVHGGGKDIIAALLGTRPNRKKSPWRHRNKGDSVSSVPETDSVASKHGHHTKARKSRSKGTSSNRSAENILQQVEDESSNAPSDEPVSENVEVSFEIRKKYEMKEFSYFCIENEKRSIRRAKSNDSLMPQHKITIRQPVGSTAAGDKSRTLPKDVSKSQEMLDDYASSGDATTSEDGRSESCGSSVLESET